MDPRNLITSLTPAEKIAQLMYQAPAVPRLDLPAWSWGSELLHGLARWGRATVFPQALNLAQTWDPALVQRVAAAAADETRAKHHYLRAAGRSAPGLLAWCPNINLFRDPRWGRGQETYGEDPFLTSRLGRAFVRGLAGDDPDHVRVGAVVKHLAVHSGPDADRHRLDVPIDERELWRTYLPHFAACLSEPGALGVMGAYNRLGGEACCASPRLLQGILRDELGFRGFVISDGGALSDLFNGHGLCADAAESAALALRAGCDVCLGDDVFTHLPEALRRGLINEADLDRALERLIAVRTRLGGFAPPETVRWSSTPIEVVDSADHRALALEAARASLVLLYNNGLLPLQRDRLRKLLVVGPRAADVRMPLGNYNGTSGRIVSVLEGLAAAIHPGTVIEHWTGCDVASDDRRAISHTAMQAGGSDAIIAVLGLDPFTEGEEYDAPLAARIGDRDSLELPGVQRELLEALLKTGRPVVLVLTGCAPQAIGFALDRLAACVLLGYPGEECGAALADVLLGAVNPSGRLAVTWPKSVDDLPPFADYGMAGRTYRFATAEPLFPFGFGLSYTRFAYSDLVAPADVRCGDAVTVSVRVSNTGTCAGSEVVQLYANVEGSDGPLRQLAAFSRITLQPGETQSVSMTVPPHLGAQWSLDGNPDVRPGRLLLTIAGHQGDARSVALTGQDPLRWAVALTGPVVRLRRGAIDVT